PDLAVRAPAEFRRVRQDDVVLAAAALLALDELHRILADPADRQLFHAAERLVLARPADRLLGSIDMGDLRTGAGGDERGDAGIAKEVQHLDGPAGRLDLLLHPAP